MCIMNGANEQASTHLGIVTFLDLKVDHMDKKAGPNYRRK